MRQTWYISQHAFFQMGWETILGIAIHASTCHPNLYHHNHCYLPHPLLIFQTLRVGFIPSSILYLLIYLQLKIVLLYFRLIIGTMSFTKTIIPFARNNTLTLLSSTHTGWFGIPFRILFQHTR